VIRYTLDGTEPHAASTTYASPLSIASTLTLKAVVFKTGWALSNSGAASYWIPSSPPATPTITPTAGAYTEAPMVSIATATSGATIRFTVDGTEPTATSALYSYPFMVTATTTIKAKAFKAGATASATATAAYALDPAGAVATPSISPTGGRFTTRQTVTVTGPAGATLRYTTTGIDPTTADATVTSGATLVVDRSMVLKVRAFQSGLDASLVRRADYVITGALTAGNQHSLALKADRTVWAWGRNDGPMPLVGDGSGVVLRLSPVQLTSIGPAIAIAAGTEHTLAVKEAGTVVAWGTGLYGRLGDNTAATRNTPVAVTGLSSILNVAAGAEHSLAVDSMGRVWAWGRNDRGQLGNGTTMDALAPIMIPGIAGAVAIAAGDKFSLVLTTDGGVGGHLWAFGANDSGQLGDGSTLERRAPVRVLLSDVVGMEAGSAWSLARTADGRLWTFGQNNEGQLGNGVTVNASLPTEVVAVASADLIAGGQFHAASSDHAGRLWLWGDGANGQLGVGDPYDKRAPALSGVIKSPTAIAGGTNYTLAATADGAVWATGLNLNGALGIGTTSSPLTWTSVSSLTLATQTWLSTDTDGDGLTAWREYLLATDPLNADSNANGIPDGAEASTGRPAANPDVDGDGLSWVQEAQRGTDPYRADTDGDGVSDLADLFPLDPTRTALPPPTPGDTTPPVITLIEPTNAVPIP
jgi:alpha-tubulin suppressor-like RCC1 family protein